MKPEEHLQISVAKYINMQYPNILWCHIANERHTSPARGAKLKRMGVRSGMPDIMIYHPVEVDSDYGSCGLAIELKVKGGKVQPSQWQTLEKLGDAGWETHICYSFDEAKKVIDNYLS